MIAPGPNGCTCGNNGDCNCPFVASAASDATRLRAEEALAEELFAGLCPHGKAADEFCDACDSQDEPDDSDETCTCSRSRADLREDSGFPCDCCGRMVR